MSKKKAEGVDAVLEHPYLYSPAELLKSFEVANEEKGLSAKQVSELQVRFGPNELKHEEKTSLFEMIMEQFEDLLVRILLGAACVSFILAYFDEANKEEGLMAYIEPFVILAILIANAIVGVWQESSAEAALDALKRLQSDHAKVVRDGKLKEIEAVDLVPGDIVHVRVGDKVPADLRMLKLSTTTIRVEQSQLTGESVSVNKESDALHANKKGCEIQSKSNMLFASTTISNGSCVGMVVATGMRSEIGKIQEAVTAAGEEDSKTPLQQKIDEFGELLAKVIFLICAVVWVINYKHFFDPVHGSALRGSIYYFKIAVALAVAAIPEGLPAVITTCLALGSRRMAVKNAIVRKLPSVETLGCTTVICSDKTGTLTTNEMTCLKLAVPATSGVMKVYNVEGTNYTPVGKIDGFKSFGKNDVLFQTLCRASVLCNTSGLVIEDGKYKRIGEPTELALRVLIEKMGCPDEALNAKYLQRADRGDNPMAFSQYWEKGVVKHATLEFMSDRKSMSVLVREPGKNENTLFVKGAPETILERCTTVMLPSGQVETLTAAKKQKIVDGFVSTMAASALRTLAIAVRLDCVELRDFNKKASEFLSDPANFVKAEQDLTFLGLVGILDPPRPECKPAIAACRDAGISVIMITGDNKQTAEAIAKDLGILQPGEDGPEHKKSFTGKEFEAMTDRQRADALRDTTGMVFSRTEPKHKQMIVKILKDLGEVCAMTGDGVNDAPALRQADIGIAMGLTGTEVAKEASDMVLTDDNFSTIVSAVEEGRSIYNNMKAFIRYLISSNIGEVASIFFTAALGIPEGLVPVQLLWVNLVTDGLPATALSFNPPDLDVMQKPPRNKDDPLITGWVFFRYMVIGTYVGFATVGILIYWYVFDTTAPDGHTLVTMQQLMNWGSCSTWTNFQVSFVPGMTPGDACSIFAGGKSKASTLSLTVLVMIEMLNAMNALSEDGSLLQVPPWANPWLILAALSSVMVHFVVLYVPFMSRVFGVVPLTWHDWVLVMYFSLPVILVDEVLKLFGRRMHASRARVAHYKKL